MINFPFPLPLILDGATGTNLIAAGMPSGVCVEQWILEHPEVIIDLQAQFVQAGVNADVYKRQVYHTVRGTFSCIKGCIVFPFFYFHILSGEFLFHQCLFHFCCNQVKSLFLQKESLPVFYIFKNLKIFFKLKYKTKWILL